MSYQLLSTKEIHAPLQEELRSHGFGIEFEPMIRIELEDANKIAEVLRGSSGKRVAGVFTSGNSVLAVERAILEEAVDTGSWEIFCLNGETKTLLGKSNLQSSKIIGEAANAEELAEVIIRSKTSSVLFFCGDQRRDELPQRLKTNGVECREVVVYKTIELFPVVKKIYDGILFFSPSGVRSFFKKNSSPRETILFAIGNTTAKEILNYSHSQVVTSSESTQEALVSTIIKTFQDRYERTKK